jgi:inosose dehydratase
VTDLLHRVAGAPITWGVDGSPGWGHIMDRDRVLSEMVELGLRATELGPDGYLPRDPDALEACLDHFGLDIVAGFVPAVLYRPDQIDGELAYVNRACRQLAATGSQIMVLGPDSHFAGYDRSVDIDEASWTIFLQNLERLNEIVASHDLVTALHPHWGMAIERRAQVERLLESSDVSLCLDTGHLFLGGVDPVELARSASDRVSHVHLKDVDGSFAARVRAGEVGFRRAVIDGMFRPLGDGDVDIAGVIAQLEGAGYRGWYVVEQDKALAAAPPEDAGPKEDVARSIAFLHRVAAELPA